MTYKEIIEILKDFGRTKGHVWFFNSITRKKIDLKYDTTRRYFMTTLYNGDYEKTPSMQRVSQDVFENNIKWLSEHGFSICF